MASYREYILKSESVGEACSTLRRLLSKSSLVVYFHKLVTILQVLVLHKYLYYWIIVLIYMSDIMEKVFHTGKNQLKELNRESILGQSRLCRSVRLIILIAYIAG